MTLSNERIDQQESEYRRTFATFICEKCECIAGISQLCTLFGSYRDANGIQHIRPVRYCKACFVAKFDETYAAQHSA